MTRLRKRSVDPVSPLAEPHPHPQGDYSRLDDVAGHRVMRRFAVGGRATLLLAHSGVRGSPEAVQPRLIKVFHAETTSSSIDAEIAALCIPELRHVVRLVDVATITPGAPPCLVFEKLPGPTLLTVLEDNPPSSAGQAVTILAPICGAIQSLHDAGVTHGAIQARRIVFDRRGAPILTGFGRGVERDSGGSEKPPVPPASQFDIENARAARDESWRRAVLDDQRQLLSLVERVLERVPSPSDGSRLDTAHLESLIGEGPSREFLIRLEATLFDFAAPEAVSVNPSAALGSPAPATSIPSMVLPDLGENDWSSSAPQPPAPEAENRVVAALRVLGASSRSLEIASTCVESLRQFSHRRNTSNPPTTRTHDQTDPSSTKRGRRPIVVGAVCAIASATVLLLVIPSGAGGSQAGARPRDSIATPSVTAPSNQIPTAAAVPPDTESAVMGDDPVAALRGLSIVTADCATSGEAQDCAETVYQADFLQSRPAVETAGTIDATDALLTGRWGGSALVSAHLNGQPASFLLMKGEAGWRVRDVFEESQ